MCLSAFLNASNWLGSVALFSFSTALPLSRLALGLLS